MLGCSHIGDVLYRTASLDLLRSGLPDCEWDIVCEPGSAKVLGGNCSIRRVLTEADLEDIGRRGGSEWDVALCFDSSGYAPYLLRAVGMGIPARVAYVHRGFSGLVTHPVSIRQPQPFAAYFRDLVTELTGRVGADVPLRPVVVCGEAENQAARELRRKLRLDDGRPVLPIFVTTRQARGVWPPERFGEVAALLEAKVPQLQVVLMGGASDRAILERLKARFGLRAPVSAGDLDLRSLVAFLGRCAVVLAVDSGPRHLAGAAGVPVVFARNVAYDPVEAGKYLATETDCVPTAAGLISAADESAFLARIDSDGVAQLVIDRLAEWKSFGAA